MDHAVQQLSDSTARIVEAIADGHGLDDILDAVCTTITEQLPGAGASVHRIDASGDYLIDGGHAGLSRAWMDRFVDGEHRPDPTVLLGPWYRRGATIIPDVTEHERWATLRAAARDEGLGGCYACPVVSSDGVAHAITLVYWDHPHRITADERRLVHHATILATLAIDRQVAEARIAIAANHDPLTGLPNRTVFLERLRHSLARARRHHGGVAVLFLDIDRFKVINDSLGHAAGDRILVTAASRLLTAVRPGDTVARFGGDEFTVLCEDVADAVVARSRGQRLADELGLPITVAHRRFSLSSSIGVALGAAGSKPQELVRDADVAMYRAKERGRNRIEVFDAGLRLRTLRRLEDETALRRVIDTGTVTLHYQPIFDVKTLRVRGVEALLRGRRDDGEAVDPADLIRTAEDAGLIQLLGQQIIRRAGAQLGAWVGDGIVDERFSMSVNVAAGQLDDRSLMDSVVETLAHNHLRPDQLTLELTESGLIVDHQHTVDLLRCLQRLGVRLHIDDFGTGYSSLDRLRHLPVAGIKIDRSFVADLDVGRTGLQLLVGVTRLARALDLEVVAEGVETPEQLRLISTVQCDAVQGFYLGRPQDADQIEVFLATHRPPAEAPTMT